MLMFTLAMLLSTSPTRHPLHAAVISYDHKDTVNMDREREREREGERERERGEG